MVELKDLWEQTCKSAEQDIPSHQVRAWIRPLLPESLSQQKIQLVAPNEFTRDWVLDQYLEVIEAILSQLRGEPTKVSIRVEAESKIHENQSDKVVPSLQEPLSPQSSPSQSLINQSSNSNDDVTKNISPSAAVQSLEKASFSSDLNSKYTFDSFVVGSSNQFAHAACRAVAEQPAYQYNPLFIYSEAGLGKTHLLHAIGHTFLHSHPRGRVCYISAESFTNELIDHIRNHRMPQFRQKYRDGFDLLLMDDFQFIAGRDRTQEEFFHTFNSLQSSRRQIVVTSDKSPKDIPGLEDRVRTRFESGLIADIQPPEIETRIAILKAKAQRDDFFLPDSVALFLASNIKTNIRELEGALLRLEAQASLSGVEITLDLARRELSEMSKEPVLATMSADSILHAVSKHFALRISDLKGKDRSRKVSLPRQITMYLLRKYTSKSLPEIGLLLGGKDHSTILHGIHNVQLGLNNDPIVQQHVRDVQNLL